MSSKKEASKEQQPQKAVYLIDVRIDLPVAGGQALPRGCRNHGYVTFRLTEKEPGAGISEKQALSTAKLQAGKDFPLATGMKVTSVSLLPENW